MAAKKSAATRTSTATSAGGGVLRGPDLVARVIAAVQAETSAIAIADPLGLAPAVLDALTFSDGTPLPASLRAWLAFDATWWATTRRHFSDLQQPRLAVTSLPTLACRHVAGGDVQMGRVFAGLAQTPLGGRVLRLGLEGEAVSALYLSGPTANDEPPVVSVDCEDMPRIRLTHAGFDVWLADTFGVLSMKEQAAYEALLDGAAAALGGAHTVEMNGTWGGEDRKGKSVWTSDAEDGPFADVEPKDLDDGPPPIFPISKPVPKMTEGKHEKLLLAALEARDASRAAWLLDAALERFPEGSYRDAALRAAVKRGLDALAAKLVASGASVKGLIGTAADRGNAALVKLLLDAGADPDEVPRDGKSALGYACTYLREEAVAVLLAHGVKVDQKDDLGGATPLLNAAGADGERAAVRRVCAALLDAGANIDFEAKSGWTAMHWAIEKDDVELVKLLLARGGSPEVKNHARDTALMSAWKERRYALYDVLRAAGGRRDARCREGFCLSDVASEDGRAPASFEVAVTPSREPQPVELRVKVAMWSGGQPSDVVDFVHRHIERAVVAMAEGAFTGDAFSASDAVATLEPASDPPRAGKEKIQELRYTLRVGGVGAVGLALFVRLAARLVGDQAVAAFSLRGASGEAGGLDTATALAALADPPVLAAPTALPFELAWTGAPAAMGVAEAPPGVRVMLPSAKDHKATLEKLFGSWMAAASATVPGLTAVPSGGFLVPRVKVQASRIELLPGFAAVGHPFSLTAAAPMLLGMLARMKARGTPIERVEIGS